MTDASLRQAVSHARELIDLLVRLDVDTAIGTDLEDRLRGLVADVRPHALDEREMVLPPGLTPRSYTDRSPVTGHFNPMAPPVDMAVDGSVVTSSVTLGLAYQGPPGRVHGGWVAMLLDHLMGMSAGQVATSWIFTRSLTVDYALGVPLFEQLDIEAHVAEVDGRKIWVEGSISSGGATLVNARGLWLGPREG